MRVSASRHLRASDHPKMSVRAELARRHSESLAELLAKVVFGIEPAAACDLRNAKVAGLEKTRGFAESLFLEEMAQEPAGDAMKTAGYVLPGVPKLLGNGLHGDLLVIAYPSAYTLNE